MQRVYNRIHTGHTPKWSTRESSIRIVSAIWRPTRSAHFSNACEHSASPPRLLHLFPFLFVSSFSFRLTREREDKNNGRLLCGGGGCRFEKGFDDPMIVNIGDAALVIFEITCHLYKFSLYLKNHCRHLGVTSDTFSLKNRCRDLGVTSGRLHRCVSRNKIFTFFLPFF